MSLSDSDPVAASFPRTGRYRYVRTLGQGGMGTVFEAYDREHHHSVALKTVLGTTPASIDMLVNEFRARRVDHQNLVRLLELSVEDDQTFFTMELLEATDLAHWVWAADQVRFSSTMTLGADDTGPQEHPLVAASSRPRLSSERTRALARICCDLVSALHALHRAGLVHRDVKPGNILVTEAGRVVLADFGLATGFLAAPGEPPAQVPIAGTPGYMAPELLAGRPSPASDLFALGATIVHAVTGAPPAQEGAGSLDRVCEDERLITLVQRMLAEGELERPDAEEVFEVLANVAELPVPALNPPGLRRSHSLMPHLGRGVFVGRDAELTTLARAFEQAAERDAVTLVRLRGPSGVGKTTLINEWLRNVEREPGLLVLRGHCHRQERIAFGGFDNAIKNLRTFLCADYRRLRQYRSRLPGAGTVFSSLRGLVPDPPPRSGGDDKERRLIAFAELRGVLEGVAEHHRLVIWIDDLQWLDADSLSLLSYLVSDGGLPRVLLITSYRSEEDQGVDSRLGIAGTHCVEIELGGLSRLEIARVVDAHGGGAERLDDDELFEATQGLPIFAEILGQRGPGQGVGGELSDRRDPLSRIIEGTIDRLDDAARRLFSTIALSPQPLPRDLATEAAATPSAAVVLRVLEDAGLLRYAVGAERNRLSVFHDRIRAAHLIRLGADEKQRLHARIADVYEEREPRACEALAYHNLHADRSAPAIRYSLLAAERAEQTLAFATAAEYYEQVLELRPEDEDAAQLWAKLAGARANEGRSELAGGAFEHAVQLLDADSEFESSREDLLTRAAAEYLHCGRVRDGYRILHELLARHGLQLPRSHSRSVMKSAWLRMRFVVEGYRMARPRSALDPELSRRLHVLWIACTGLAHINHLLADVLLLMHLRTALRAGSREHAFKALTYEGAAEATIGGRFFERRADRLLAAGRAMLSPEVVEGVDARDYDLAWYWVSSGARAFFAADWPTVVQCARRADEHLDKHGVGVSWERSVNNLYWLFALALMGDVEALGDRHRIAFSDALRRADPLAQNACRSGYSGLLWLYRGELDRAREEVELVLDGDRWATDDTAALPWPEGGFRTPDYHNLLARVHIHLYAGGEGLDAYRRLAVAWPHLERAMFLTIRFVGVDLRYLLGRAALAARRELLEHGSSEAWPEAWTASVLEAQARRQLRHLARSSQRSAKAYAHALRAGLPRLRPALRQEGLRLAARAFDELHMQKHSAAARHWLGEGNCPLAVARMLVPDPAGLL